MNCNLTDEERSKGILCRGMFCDKCADQRMKIKSAKEYKEKIFNKLIVDFSFIGFHKTLDKALALFLEENLTFENKKTMNDFSIMDFCVWVSDKKKESEGN